MPPTHRKRSLPGVMTVVLLGLTISGPANADAVGGADVAVPQPASATLSEAYCRGVAGRIAANPDAEALSDLFVDRARCEIQAGRHEAALTTLAAARSFDPDRSDLDLWVGIAEFHLGRYDDAKATLDATVVDTDQLRARLLLYRGQVLTEIIKRIEAHEALDRDTRRPLRTVEPVNFYYAANPWRQNVLRGEARDLLEQARQYDRADWFGFKIAEARQDVTGKRSPWFAGTVEFRFDDTVTLLGSGVDTPDEISETGGFEFNPNLYLEGGGEVLQVGKWSVGLLSSLYGTFPQKSDHLDVAYPTVSAYTDWTINERMTARFRYDLGYAWVDGDGFSLTNDLTMGVHNRSESWGESGAWARVYYNEFYDDPDDFPIEDMPIDGLCDSSLIPPFPSSAPSCAQDPDFSNERDRNQGSRRERSGFGFLIGLDWRKQFDWNQTEVRVGYTYQHFIPNGAEFHNQSHGFDLGFNTALPFGFALDVWGAFIYHPFRSQSTYPEPETVRPNRTWSTKGFRRRDQAWQIAVTLERYLLDYLKVWAQYSYMNNRSNRGSFDYSRKVAGIGISAIYY
jgi:tetratricopeptide (TPR) repeat protein